MSAPDYKALFEAEQRSHEDTEAEAAELRKLACNTTLPEYLDFCHTYLFQTFTIPTNKELTTQDDVITNIKGMTHPHFILPWVDFPKIQDSTWKRLRHAYPPAGPRAFDPLAYFKSCGNSISKRLLTSELNISFLHRLSVENPVSDILNYLHTLPDVEEEFGLKSTGVIFDNPPNALIVDDKAIPERDNTACTNSTPILCTPPTPPGPLKADQICVYTTEVNGRPTNRIAFTVEHQSPQKISLDLLRVALHTDRDAIPMDPLMGHVGAPSSKDEPSYSQYKADTAVAGIVTQAYSNMIAGKTCFGYITTGEAFVFLYIYPDFPQTVYYHLVEPRGDVETQMTAFPGTEFYLSRTAVSQVLAFSLLALEPPFTPLDSRLTSLPPELRHQILTELELDQLSALVRASSVFHQDYRCNRRFMLANSLQLTLRSVAVDAYVVAMSSHNEPPNRWYPFIVATFLQSYQDQRASAHKSHFTKYLTEDLAIRMAAFHSSIVMPLAYCYVDWAMTNFPKKLKICRDRGPLSKAEETRVLRALYRFQLCCNLFGAGCFDEARASRTPFEFLGIEILKMFLSLFEPWEVEEMVCIHAFAKKKLKQTFKNIREDVDKWSQKFLGQRPPTPPGRFDWDDKHKLLEGTISRGLDILHILFFKVQDHEQLIIVMQAQITPLEHGFLEDAFSRLTQKELDEDPPSHRQQKEDRGDPLLFTGDGDLETDGPRPPKAWTVLCGELYRNMFGGYVNHVISQWGYVMWDAARLDIGDQSIVPAQRWWWQQRDEPDYLSDGEE
ncbi:MAG: hypothetical protein M1839_006758 [Geoglossum umbratile]|nr:MAG: hypothetical protein M1839_006758 [Geoglossum umbratile]